MIALALASACSSPPAAASVPAAPPPRVEAVAAAPVTYEDRKAAIARTREDLAARFAAAGTDAERAAVRVEAARAATDGLATGLFPAWAGTPWDFYGTTEQPGTGEIACGYYVSTTLRDAGFRVERVRLAQQPAEYIVKTLVPPDRVRRYRTGDVEAVVAGVERDGEGLYVVGLDFHVGYLWNDGAAVRMCHSSYFEDAVVCEDARTSPAMVSRYHVVGKLMSDGMIDTWLQGGSFPTVRG